MRLVLHLLIIPRVLLMTSDLLRITYSPTPPPRVACNESDALFLARQQVGQCEGRAWGRAVSARDPVTLLKRWHGHVNRATFKMYEVLDQMSGRDVNPTERALLLAEAPGGFLYAVRNRWPDAHCAAMTYSAPGAIQWADATDPAVMHGLPHDGDLTRADVEDAIAHRGGEGTFDLVTADGGAEADDLDLAEQSSTCLVLAQMSVALRMQACGGTLVLKIFEGCTHVTRQLFELTRSLYTHIMLSKPCCSKACNSERYFIAIGLRDCARAKAVAAQLREAVSRCAGKKEAERVYVTNLGIDVSSMVHRAFDTMALNQSNEIRKLVECIASGDASSLRRMAKEEVDRQKLK